MRHLNIILLALLCLLIGSNSWSSERDAISACETKMTIIATINHILVEMSPLELVLQQSEKNDKENEVTKGLPE